MTDITNIIILTSIDDGAWMKSDHGNVDVVHEYLRKNYQGSSLAKVDGHGGGRKRMSCDIFMAAIDYLNKEELLEQFHAIEWQRPEQVQLLLKGSKDNVFQVYCPKI
ncbi:hypothetical protein [Saccharospirillum alexandrii]|uniref:hypothetical protein n=1 Tax=Saccharospirillum alexandrii TaxID=2448477 RepID=UPI000FDBD0F5|nr:hypothetical protein [Saccharospirillum alexandrii]